MELYDRRKDPEEITNQSNNPEYAEVVRKMQKLLVTRREVSGTKLESILKGCKFKGLHKKSKK